MTSRKTPTLRTLKKPPTPDPSPVRARESYPTPGEMNCLRVFATLREELKRSPTVREVGARLGISATGAQGYLERLQAKGYLEAELEPRVVGHKLTPLGKKWAALP